MTRDNTGNGHIDSYPRRFELGHYSQDFVRPNQRTVRARDKLGRAYPPRAGLSEAA